ncbi:MAG: polysaccharide pyruvyl transferase family protein [Hallella sp.]|uniref:polysaccharide pyruvyl transferase family protein n=1 Tax=Hallella sp. TaxID=2980186 RepID=UPI002E779FBE|nr:polysaccharide pyruvyl transferase family protein [Hallella sp.]MED9945840.1 polysaccharide pyruvyl transferase family protein [Hallella sp.]
MRIGILTLPLHTNYGGILQAFALQTVLERMGHEVVVFDTPNKVPWPPLWKLPLSIARRTLLRCLGKIDRVFVEYHKNVTRSVVSKNIQPFVDSQIHRKVIRDFNNLDSKDYDAIVVGSDQVWRVIYFPYLWGRQAMENAYLSFAQNWNVKAIAYAASFGTDDWEYSPQLTESCKRLIRKFDAVSVREDKGVGLCKKFFDVEAQQVLDPTMLLSKDDYVALFMKAQTPRSKGTLLNYVLDQTAEIENLIKTVAFKKHLVPFAVNNPYENDETKPLQERVKPGVETWLRGFYDADYVITDSFHACVFAILFKKQFLVVGNKKRGMSRFESLLKQFGLEGRLVDEYVNIETIDDIDYDVVYHDYDTMKEKSLSFLKEHLT